MWLFFLACTGPSDSEPAHECAELPTPLVSLPADDVMHHEPIEWWYWTGHLEDDAGRRYGFEHTVFAIDVGTYQATSVHVGLTDVSAATFGFDVTYIDELPVPLAQGFAFDVEGNTAAGGDGHDTLHSIVGGSTIDVTLEATDPPVLQHGDGYHDYEIGGNTYYYSRERMAATGVVNIGGEARPVTGDAWFDHQYGNLIAATDAGWDWFALQLDDGREVMLFLVRDTDGLIGGSVVDADGCVTEVTDFQVTKLGEWTSPHTGCTYPMGWDVRVGDLNVTVTPSLEDQEIYSDFQTYWEGESAVTGDATGRAYVELAGYCG